MVLHHIPLTGMTRADQRQSNELQVDAVNWEEVLSLPLMPSVLSLGDANPPRQIILPGVLEISAAAISAQRQDEEVEERNRLQEMAAQAIDLGHFMVSQDSGSRAESTTEDEDDDPFPASENNSIPRLGHPLSSESTPNIMTRSPHDYNLFEPTSALEDSAQARC
jgi:hypothetical protein